MSTKLMNRLSRIQGQLEALKTTIDTAKQTQEQCLQNLTLLKAAINGLKRFGAAYMAEHIQQCLQNGMSLEELEEVMLLSINTGVDL